MKQMYKVEKRYYSISEVLHLAADYHLSRSGEDLPSNYISKFSCCAVEDAVFFIKISGGKSAYFWNILDGLGEMGVDTDSVNAFGDVPKADRQQYRYAWLKFAALLAEEQGV